MNQRNNLYLVRMHCIIVYANLSEWTYLGDTHSNLGEIRNSSFIRACVRVCVGGRNFRYYYNKIKKN